MAYTDVSTSKADVPKRTRIVSEQEQAKTDSRRLVRFIFICPVLRCPALPYFQSTAIATEQTALYLTRPLLTALQAKTKEESTIKRAHDEIKDSKAQQAEARYR